MSDKNETLFWMCQRPGCGFQADKGKEECDTCKALEADDATRQGIMDAPISRMNKCNKRGPVFTLAHVGKEVTIDVKSARVHDASREETYVLNRAWAKTCDQELPICGKLTSVTQKRIWMTTNKGEIDVAHPRLDPCHFAPAKRAMKVPESGSKRVKQGVTDEDVMKEVGICGTSIEKIQELRAKGATLEQFLDLFVGVRTLLDSGFTIDDMVRANVDQDRIDAATHPKETVQEPEDPTDEELSQPIESEKRDEKPKATRTPLTDDQVAEEVLQLPEITVEDVWDLRERGVTAKQLLGVFVNVRTMVDAGYTIRDLLMANVHPKDLVEEDVPHECFVNELTEEELEMSGLTEGEIADARA